MHLSTIKRLAAGATVAFTIGLAAGCGNITTPATSAPSATGSATSSGVGSDSGTVATPAVDTGSKYANFYKPKGTPVTVTAGQAVTIDVGNLYFDPNTLTVTKGTKVTIDLNSSVTLPHNFTLDAFNINQNIGANAKTSVSFTPTTAGTYYFYCNVPGHAQAGMVGKLTVQ